MLIAEVASAYYLRMPAGALTQGDIWSGLPSIYRSDRKTLGMVITPRCDFAHDKAPVINYLPLIPFDDYFLFEGGCELMEQELRRAADVVHTRAELLGIEQLLEGGVELSEALKVAQDQIGNDRWSSPKVSSQVDQLRGAVLRHSELEALVGKGSISSTDLASHVTEKNMNKAKRDIARNTVADLHFLPPCPPLFERPMLVQLRSVASIPREAIDAAVRSRNNDAWQKMRASLPEHIAAQMPSVPGRLVRLRSPYLEALMARFGMLFARVGTRDIPETVLSAMTNAKVSK